MTSQDALRYARILNKQGYRALLNQLGEKTNSSADAVQKTDVYQRLLQEIAGQHLNASLSIKLSDLGLRHDQSIAEQNLSSLLSTAQELQRVIEIDMEFRGLVEPTITLARRMLRQGFQFRLAIQSGLASALPSAASLLHAAQVFGGNIGFRIVTGSCYSNLGGYETTLETSESQTIGQFYALVGLAWCWHRKGGLQSAVGTRCLDRLIVAADKGLEIQLLKGEERTSASEVACGLHQDQKANIAFYVGFGSLDDAGVQAYLLRRLKK